MSAENAKKYAASPKGKETRRRIRKTQKNKDLQKRWRASGGSAREYQRNKLKYKDTELRRKYNITLEDYNQLREQQEFSCKICCAHESEFKKGLAVDHCHITMEVRGLLCGKCNTTLGNMNDDPELLQRAIDYLRKRR